MLSISVRFMSKWMIMVVGFPDVRDALAVIVREALVELTTAESQPTYMTLPDVTGWTRHSQEIFMARQRRVWNHPDQLIASWWWASLPGMAAFEAALSAHPELSERVETMVGFPFQTKNRDLRSLLITEVLTPLVRTSYTFDQEVFEVAYERLEAGLLENEVHMVELIPLLGLTLAVPELVLSGGLSIREMTDRELSVGLQTLGVPAEQMGTNSLRVSWLNQYALVKAHTFPIQIGHLIDPVPFPFPSFEEPARRLVTALRLVSGGSVSIGRPLRMQDAADFGADAGFGAVQTAVDLPDQNRPTVLASPEDAEMVSHVFQQLALPDVYADRPLQMALRRTVAAGSRALPEDRLIDLLVAAEGLFIQRAGGSNGPGKSNLIAPAAAQLLANDKVLGHATGPNIEQLVKDAYRRRNHEMHADTRTPPGMHRLDGTVAPGLAMMVGDLERLMRRAAVLVIGQVASQTP